VARYYRLVIKGPVSSATREARRRGFHSISVVDSEPTRTIVVALHNDERVVSQWFTEAPHEAPFPNGALLHYRDETGQQTASKQGVAVDDDLEGLADEFHPWSVSTLVKGLHGKPTYRYFDDFGEALAYARDRARKGKRLRDGGKAYFILGHQPNKDGVAVYRVFRTLLGAEQSRGGTHHAVRREFVVVQEPFGTHPNSTATRWRMNWSYSVEILPR
jgi:hypothetical protein